MAITTAIRPALSHSVTMAGVRFRGTRAAVDAVSEGKSARERELMKETLVVAHINAASASV